MYNKRYKKSNKKIYGMCTIIVLLIYTISICYSTLQQQLEINGLVKVRRQENIRVTGVEVDDSASSAISNWEEYDVKNVSAGISLPSSDSSITYKVKVTNFGNVDMGIYNIDGLDNRLEYEITEYELKEKINSGGNKQEFKITIKYKDGSYDASNTNYNILLNFDFRAYYNVTYIGFPDGAINLPKEVMERDTLTVDLSSYKDARYKIIEDNITLPNDRYTYINNIITISSVEGDIEITYKKIPEIELVLREDDKNKTLSEDIQAGMYRYQGSYEQVTNNYICFGTSSKDECLNNKDKYMYRIIGITEDGQLELIKMTALNDTGVPWNSVYRSEWNTDVDKNEKTKDADVPWSESDLYKRLNGKLNNNDNLFIGNNTYDYLNESSPWYNKIADTEWLSGQLLWDNISFQISKIYNIETGKEIALHYEEANPYYYNGGIEAVSEDSKYTERRAKDSVTCERFDNLSINKVSCYKIVSEKFNDKVTAKVGLMYTYDYDYSVQKDGFDCFYDNIWNPDNGIYKNNGDVCKQNWINISNNDNANNEYIMLMYGFSHNSDVYYIWEIDSKAYIIGAIAYEYLNVRPVFYLTTDITFKDGTTGEKDNPYRIKEPEPDIMQDLRKNDDLSFISEDLVGDMYRYQGTDNVNNWICFGTAKNCGANDTDIDKYMYRIIGITEDGQLALIKETAVKEDSATAFQWHNKDLASDCGEDRSKCNWANSKLFNRINGLCNTNNQADCKNITAGSKGDTNIFIGNSYYEYLTNESIWLDKISNHIWKYGKIKSYYIYNGDTAYSIESQFSNSIEAKIGLQYVQDYLYAYPGGNPGGYNDAKNAWIHFRRDGYNTGNSTDWAIPIQNDSDWILPSYVGNDGMLDNLNITTSLGNVRPVFYLTPDIILKDGTTGEKTNPYIIE